MSEQLLSRRVLLHAGLVGAGACIVPIVTAEAAAPPRPGAVRFVHMTDMHVQPETRGGEGWDACLKSLRKLDPAPQFILTGGDHIFDALAQTPQRCQLQWDLYSKIWKDEIALPTHAVLGNHDVAGWTAADKYPPTLAGYGKAMVLEKLAMPARYYSFIAGGWKFIMLDSVSRREPGYLAQIDDEQKAWLQEELSKTDRHTPIAIVSHIPILSIAIFFFASKPQEEGILLSDALQHRDGAELFKIFEKHDNVKLILSGHLHLVDRCDYKGRSFICDGAVSGRWWKGAHQGFSEGYGVFDVQPDGTFEHQYVTFGWQAEA